MFSKRHFFLLLVLTVFVGCATRGPGGKDSFLTKLPPEKIYGSKESIPETVPLPKEATSDQDPFRNFPERYRAKAIEFERKNKLRQALISWQVVFRFKPRDQESKKRIEALQTRILSEADHHFRKGLENHRNGSIWAARKEFLMALACDPNHTEALNYLRQRLNEKDCKFYITKEGDTIRSVAREVYHDPEKDFLLAYFNDLSGNERLDPGIQLMVPDIESVFSKTTYSEELIQRLDPQRPKPEKSREKARRPKENFQKGP